jgi:hypothetical protein
MEQAPRRLVVGVLVVLGVLADLVAALAFAVAVGGAADGVLAVEPGAEGAGDGGQAGGQPGEHEVVGEGGWAAQGGGHDGGFEEEQGSEHGEHVHRGGHDQHADAQGEHGGGVVEEGLLALALVAGVFPEVVGADDPGDHQGDRYQQGHDELGCGEAGGEQPDRGVDGQVGAGAQHGGQGGAHAEHQAPGLVGAHHPGEQAGPAAPGGGHVAAGAAALAGPQDADRLQVAREGAREPDGVVAAVLEAGVGVAGEVGDQADDGVAHLVVLQERAEAGQGEPGDAAVVVDVGQDRALAVLHRQVGEVDADVPPGVTPLLGDRVEDLFGVLHRGGDRVGHGADLPGDLAVDPRAQLVGQVVDQLRGDLGGGVRVGEQAHHQGAATVSRRPRALWLVEVGHRCSSPRTPRDPPRCWHGG